MPEAPPPEGIHTPAKAAAGVRSDPYVGRVLDGRYAVRDLIAVSAMSRVYKVTQLRSGQQYALKILAARTADPDSRDQHVARERFVREATTLARLSHPNIISLADYGMVEGRPYMVMQFLDGQTLQQLLRDRTPSPRQALRLCDHLCDALEAAHSQGVVHRDIKPSNVFVLDPDSHEPRVLLFDFGIAKEVDESADLTGVDAVVGTVWYMAPEQALGDPVDGRTDIYTLGVLLYRLLMGRTPFGHHRGVSVLVAHISESPPGFDTFDTAPDLPPVLEWTVRRCLEKQPAQRFRDVHELRKALAVCRLALDEPRLDTSLELTEGRVYASEAVAERLQGTELLTRQVVSVDRAFPNERMLVLVASAFMVLGLLSAFGLALLLASGVSL